MRTTIDGAGRVVLPKPLRDELNLGAGQEIEVSLRNGRIEIEPITPRMRLVARKRVAVAQTDSPMPALSAEVVRDTLERIRR
jgi:AbrB family looped-hinge helix DNA binding protein